MTQHTPGPWKIVGQIGHEANIHGTLADGSDSCAIAFVRPQFDTDANARLIAAAPDMLATLRAIAADCEDYLNDDLEMDAGELCIAFLKAINEVHDKATGSCFVAENPVDEFGEAVTQ